MVKRTVLTIPQGADRVRETVRIEDDPSPAQGSEAFMALWRFIASLQTAPTLLRHSADCPTDVVFRHSGTGWYVETTSYLVVSNGGSSADSAPAP